MERVCKLSSCVQPASTPLRHLLEELGVVLRFLHLSQKEFHRLRFRHVGEKLTEQKDAVHLRLGEKKLFLSRSGFEDVDCGEDSAIGDLPVENELHVARSLELLENHV